MSYWRRSPCSQLEKYRKRSSIETSRSVIRPGTPPGSGQPSSSSLSTSITCSASKLPLARWKRNMLLDSVAPTKPSSASGSCRKRTSSGTRPGLAEVEGLLEPPLGEVPEVQPLPVAAGADVVDVEALLVGVGLAELRRDEHVLARLVPEVVVQGRVRAAVLPAALDLERAWRRGPRSRRRRRRRRRRAC